MALSPTELATEISEFANVHGARSNNEEVQDLIKRMLRDHRTLQQNTMRIVIEYLKAVATQQLSQCDARNEASTLLASKLLENVSDEQLYLPYI
jgi:hypothetical protein